MSIVDLFEWILVIGLGSVITLFVIVQWIRHLSEEEQRAMGEPTNSRMINDMWTCSECGAFNSPYNKRCGRCFVPKSDKNEK